MNSRERILAAINHQPIDRIPTDIWATPEVWSKLWVFFGPGADTMAELHIDGMGEVRPEYVGPPLPQMPEGETIDFWGIRTRRVDHEGGAYDELSFHPLGEARSIDDLNRYQWPDVDWFDYSKTREMAKEIRQTRVVQCGNMAPFFYHNLLRGFEQSLVDPLSDAEFTHELVGRISDFFYRHHRRMFEACGGLIDVAQVSDDLGMQTGPLISLELYQNFYAPHHKRFIQLCHEF